MTPMPVNQAKTYRAGKGTFPASLEHLRFLYQTLAPHASARLHGMLAVGPLQGSATKQPPALAIGGLL